MFNQKCPDTFQVAIDLPGHGLSSHYPEGMTYKASDSFFNIHRVQDHLKWEKSAIIGHSMGKKTYLVNVFKGTLAQS